ncbi:MAG: AAA family ATPase [Bradymonadia bacterium]|jgi:DNA polymerase III delta prime subunit
MFKKATKQALHIKLAISGPSGSGKTYSALRLARGLGGKVAVLDTENRSASLYADHFDFDTYDVTDPRGYPPEYFIAAIQNAQDAGYATLIIDSLSHEWMGKGGCLEIVDRLSKTSAYKGNSYAAWGEVTPRHRALIDAILAAQIHIIATMRSKVEYAINKESGKTKIEKLGMESIQREGMDYEFTTIFELDRDSHMASAGKDRTNLFSDPHVITEETGKRIAAWLSSDTAQAAEASFKPAQAPVQAPVQAPAQAPAKPTQAERVGKATRYIFGFIADRSNAGDDELSILTIINQHLFHPIAELAEIKQLSDSETLALGRELYKRSQQS